MKVKKVLIIILSFILVLSFVSCAPNNNVNDSNGNNGVDYDKPVTDVSSDGASDYIVVIPSDSGETLNYAAEELVNYYYKSTGVKLLIKEENELNNTHKKYISLGDTRLLQNCNLNINYSELKADGFIIRNVGESMYIAGNTERSILYGAYEFLESIVGVKFYAYDYTYIPAQPKVTLYETNIKEIPAFNVRSYLSNPLMNNKEFAVKMRMNNEFLYLDGKYGGDVGIFRDGIDSVHNTLDYVSTDYYTAHPEWFFRYYNRIKDEYEIYDLCYSHVGLKENGEIDNTLTESPVKIAITNLKNFIKNSDSTYYMIGQEDHEETCSCETCLEQEAKYGRSGMLVRFINAIAREIKEWCVEENIQREIKIITFAYYYTQSAPLDASGNPKDSTVIPDQNVYVRLAPIRAQNYYAMKDEKQDDSIKNMFSGWEKITDRFWIWSYHTGYGGYLVYYPTMHHWQDDLKMYAENKTDYVLMQSAYNEINTWQNVIETYVASKMLWNPNLDAEVLKNDFIEHYYYGVDDLVKQFINNFDVKYALNFAGVGIQENKIPLSRIGDMDTLMDPDLYSVNFWQTQLNLLDTADERIDTLNVSLEEKNNLHKRIATIRLTPQYMIAMKYDSYYLNDVFGKNNFYKQFFENCQTLGVNLYTESGSIDSLKTILGYTGA